MKQPIIVAILFFLSIFRSYAQDTLIRTGGDIIICKIQSETDSVIGFTTYYEGNQIQSSLPKSQISDIKHGASNYILYKDANYITFGFGIGLDYGGIGANVAYFPLPVLGITGGAGVFFKSPAANIGLRICSPYNPNTAAGIYLQLLYGTNYYVQAFHEPSNLNETKNFAGFTPGVGLDLYLGKQRTTILNVGLNIPIESHKIADYKEQIDNRLKSSPFPGSVTCISLKITCGLKFVID